MRRLRTGIFALVVASSLLGGLLQATPAQALSAPEVFLQELSGSEMPTGGWVPLAGARLHSVTGYEIGVRLQDTGTPGNRQRFLVQVTSVPDGHPDQQNIYSLCFPQSGPAGQIVDLDERLLYEGDGAYSLTVTASTGPDASTDCTSGPATSGSFTASAVTTARFVGQLVIDDPRDRPHFNGLETLASTGAGGTDVRCARDPKQAADGSLTGSLVIDRGGAAAPSSPTRIDAQELFKTVGVWACVARSIGSGVIPGPWSAPTATQVVQTGFYDTTARLPNNRGPTYRMTQRFRAPETAGGILTVVIRRYGRSTPLVRIRTVVRRGGVASFRFRLPGLGAKELGAHYVGSYSFAGTRFVHARRRYFAFSFDAIRTPSGRVDIQFPPPCKPRSC